MVAVIAVFGPTASGKTAVAEEVADRLGTRGRLLRRDAGVPRAADPDQPAEPADRARRDPRPRARRCRSARTRRLAHAAIDELVARAGTAVVSGGTGLYLRAALADLDVPPPPGDGVRERVLAEVEQRSGGGARAAGRPRSARGRGRARERPAAPRARARARGDRRVARAGRRPPLGEHDPAPDADRRARGPARRARAADRRAHRGDVRAGRRGGGSRRRSRRASRERLRRRSASTRSRRCPRTEARERIVIRTRRYAAYQRKWMRRIPGLVPVDGTRRWTRSQTRARAASRRGSRDVRTPPRYGCGMQFSKWHALGNSYLVVEQPDAGPLTATRVQRLCSVETGIGSDGVLEVTRRDGRARRRHDLEPGRLDGRDVGQRRPDRRALARGRDGRDRGHDRDGGAAGRRADAQRARHGHRRGGGHASGRPSPWTGSS